MSESTCGKWCIAQQYSPQRAQRDIHHIPVNPRTDFLRLLVIRSLRNVRPWGSLDETPPTLPLHARTGRPHFRKVPAHSLLRISVAALAFALLSAGARAEVVINEFFYDAPSGTSAPEFIELHNTGDEAVDLTGWHFDSGITYAFPNGTTIPAQGYLVVSGDPAAFQSTHGFPALGPWTGRLSNEGERIRLRNAGGQTADELTYSVGFPWPTAASGGGASVELIHPSLDNSLPGSWRSSGNPVDTGEAQIYIVAGDDNWRYRKGTSEPSSPVSAWRLPGFVENASWLTGRTPIGYGNHSWNTAITDMRNSYSSLYFRRAFAIAPGEVPAQLRLRVLADDGYIVWINGQEIARVAVGSGHIAYNATSSLHNPNQWDEFVLPNAGNYLVEGDNVLAIHVLNQSVGSSDILLDAELLESKTSGVAPTPGAKNSVWSAIHPPSVDQVAHSPAAPTSSQPVTVTARVRDPQGVAAVNLHLQIVAPGAYIRKSDDAYETTWTTLPMKDDGLNGDAQAGDGIFTAVVPAQSHRRLVRYRISATNSAEHVVTVPYRDDGSPNFAWFVYNGVPSWSGAFVPGSTPVVTYPGSLLAALPTYHLIATSSDVTACQYNSNHSGTRFWGSLVHNGVVYDHVQFNIRGEGSTYLSGKNKWRFHFNRARELQATDHRGRPYARPWDELNLNACASPWAAVNRGIAGLDEAIPFRLFELAGVPAPLTHHSHLRVIDAASESPGSNQFSGGNPSGGNGDFWGLYLAVEQPDGSFLNERGLPDGTIYKIEGNNGDRKHQGDGQPTDGSDWLAFRNAHTSSNANPTEAWWRANMDMDAYYTFHAINRLVGNVDLRGGYNHYFYHRSSDNRWVPMPWDLDMMFIAMSHWGTTINGTWIPGVIHAHKSILQHAALHLEFRNRAREILDLVASDPSPTDGQIGQLIHEYAEIVSPTGETITWANADAAMWNMNPRTNNSGSAKSTHRGNFFKTPYQDYRNPGLGGSSTDAYWTRTLVSSDHAGFRKYLLDYMTDTYPGGSWSPTNGIQSGYGYEALRTEAADASIPNRPTLAYEGAPDFPVDDLRFKSSAFADPQGAGTFAALQWRVAEISAPGIPGHDPSQPWLYEITDVWRSAEISTFHAEVLVPPSAVKPGHTYRVRVRHKDNTGRWSHWSQPVQFVPTAIAAEPTAANLAITEIMYNPGPITPAEAAAGITDKQLFEFIELANIGDEPVDLGSVAFTTGITFAFEPGTILAPGAFLVVVKDPAAFALRYGADKPIAGTYSGSLANEGERIVLSVGDAAIHDFLYDDSVPWPEAADGEGYSLVLIAPKSLPDYSLASSWRASRSLGGSAGAKDTIHFNDWVNDHPGVGDRHSDDDGDARTNLVEYGFHGDPLAPDLGNIGTLAEENLIVDGTAGRYLTLTFTRLVGAEDVDYIVDTSDTLSHWSDDAVLVRTRLNGDGTVTETWRASAPMDSEDVHFLRVRLIER